MDKFDTKILEVLQRNARVTLAALAEEVGLSKSPCQARIKRLEEEGVILGYEARLNLAKLGAGHIAFVQVTLNSTHDEALGEFNKAALAIREVEQCHMIASSFDYLLKVRTKDISSYRRVLGEKLSRLPHVSHTSTFVCMEAVKDVGM
ncbi:Lrp/AsnC family transcriptional regulator [Polycladidibacter hongkongensis]|uniref:Lrp/AsnC family transcriptional regulator n=1 Tax=Polycladidibacter hongkongensis TaxID=1647556 RepID=UPI0008373C95|nr:winged helix-turn-helix transcriptional regulator [Pseudovibrio hongkongensis]